jgi:N utilization substance protein A
MDMSFEVIQALKAIARQKDVDENLIVETLQAGLASAARKKLGPSSNVSVEIDEEAGSLEIFCTKMVVEKVEDNQIEISLDDALIIDSDAKCGVEIRIEIPLSHFGRNAIQAAKQVVIQRIREAERDKVFKEYEQRVGEVVNGGVQQVDRGSIIVNLGRAEAILPQREQIPREQFRQGSSIKAYIIDVTRSSKGPQVILSRANRDFLRKLFEMEVPEIKDGTVEIKAVAREPGARSKIAVMSNEEKVDAVGACVGMKGSRVQTVVRELGGERIDVVLWSEDPITFVTRALSPAKVVHADIDPKDSKVTVVVADDQLSLAIGKGGQNARLAAKLTGYKIDLINESQYAERLEFQKLARVPIIGVPGIGEKMCGKLVAAGYETADDITRATAEDLMALEGVGEKTAQKIIGAARAKIEDIKEEFVAERAARAEAEAAAEREAAEALEAARAAQAVESETDESDTVEVDAGDDDSEEFEEADEADGVEELADEAVEPERPAEDDGRAVGTADEEKQV